MKRHKLKNRIITLCLALLMGNSYGANNSPILGTWALDLIMQGGSVTVLLKFSEGEDGLQGTWEDPLVSMELTDITFDGSTVAFTRTGEFLGSVDMTLQLEGENLKGKMETQLGELLFSATRYDEPL